LEYLPEWGAPGLYPGTRVAAVFWPYVITYRIVGTDVVILRIRHGAQIQRTKGSIGEK
jgi:plasmid stabilization system protein ParE